MNELQHLELERLQSDYLDTAKSFLDRSNRTADTVTLAPLFVAQAQAAALIALVEVLRAMSVDINTIMIDLARVSRKLCYEP